MIDKGKGNHAWTFWRSFLHWLCKEDRKVDSIPNHVTVGEVTSAARYSSCEEVKKLEKMGIFYMDEAPQGCIGQIGTIEMTRAQRYAKP